MARRRSSSRSASEGASPPLRAREPSSSEADLLRTAEATGVSGRYIVLLRRGAAARGAQTLQEKAGLRMASTADSDSGAISPDELGDKQLLLASLDIAIVEMEPDQVRGVATASEDGAIEMVVPEGIKYTAALAPPEVPGFPGFPVPSFPVPGTPGFPAMPGVPAVPGFPVAVAPSEYLRGLIDGAVLGRLTAGGLATFAPAVPASFATAGGAVGAADLSQARAGLPSQGPLGRFALGAADQRPAQVTAAMGGFDEAQMGHTWGLEVTQVIGSAFSGRGVKVAILDTGLDSSHPDFAGRNITYQGFAKGPNNVVLSPRDDIPGHGTHCAGTACGTRTPSSGIRYGIASDAELFVGKVLDNTGRGLDGWILAGIEWAIRQGCRVISMSIEGPPSQSFVAYERTAKAALPTTAIIAAAGNDSRRDRGITQPVGTPANCLSIMAVAAINARMQVTFFSNRGSLDGGGAIDIAGPGEDVYSSWPMPTKYRRIDGTSMATPHVAGIAALIAEAKPDFSGADILNALTQMAEEADRLSNLPKQDVGSGLVVAP